MSGGGYSGGGSYHGGGYGYGTNNWYNQPCYGTNGTITSYTCRGSGGGDVNPLVFIFVAVAIAICCVCYCVSRSSQQNNEDGRGSPMSDEDFEKIVGDEKDEVKQHARSISNKALHIPKNGTYSMAYVDRGSTHEGTVQLSFHDVGDGYNLSGEVRDSDGRSIIDEGFVTYDGRAYWKDKCLESSSGDVGMAVVSKGLFDFETSNFQGNWTAITGHDGPYTRFSLLQEESGAGNDGSTLAESEEEDIAVPPAGGPIVPQAPVLSGDDGKFDNNLPASNQNQGGGTSLFDQMQSGLRGLR